MKKRFNQNWLYLSVLGNIVLLIVLVYLLASNKFEVKLTPTETISILLNIILFIWGFIQLRDFQNQEIRLKNKVRIWHKHIEGIKNALLQLNQNPQNFTDKSDIASAANMIAQSASALDDSFAEDRFYTDDEIKDRREKSERSFKKLLNQFKKPKEG